MPERIEPALRAFISDNIASVAQLELVLLLHGSAGQRFTAAEAARALALSPEMTERLLELLCRQGIAAATADAPSRYRYAPKSAELDGRIAELSELYRQRRVTVIQLIYSEPIDKLKSFADAFRFQQDKTDNEEKLD
jgi:hypothetical protein